MTSESMFIVPAAGLLLACAGLAYAVIGSRRVHRLRVERRAAGASETRLYDDPGEAGRVSR